jgi:hypothetical protein
MHRTAVHIKSEAIYYFEIWNQCIAAACNDTSDFQKLGREIRE